MPELTYPGGRAVRAGGLCRDLADRDQRLHRPTRPARDRRRSTTRCIRLYAHLQATDPDRFVVATAPERVRGARRGIRRRRSYANGSGICRCCSCCRSSRGPGSVAPCSARVLPDGEAWSARTATDSAPADLERPVRLVRDRAADAVAQPDRAARPAGGVRDAAVRGRRAPVRRDRGGTGRSATDGLGPSAAGRRDRRPRSRAARVSRTRSTIASCAASRATAGSTAGRTAMPVGYGYAGEAGRVGPVAVRDEALLGPVLGHLTSAVVPRGAFALWVGGAADRAIVPALAAGFRLDTFPVLLCWDRPFADFSRYLPIRRASSDRTADDGPARRCTIRHVCRTPVRVVASTPDVAPLAVPADGVVRSLTTSRRPPPHPSPAEPNVTVAPAPSASRSLRHRVLGRTRDHAKQERAVLVLHDVTKEYPNGKLALRDVDLSSPRATSSSSSGRPAPASRRSSSCSSATRSRPRGEVVLDGQDVARLGRRQVPKMRRKIGIIFQDFKLLPSKTVWENVAFALEVTGTPRRKIRPAVDRVLALVGLTAQAQQTPVAAVGRRAAADGDRPGARPRPAADHRRRADRQPRPAHQLGDPAAPAADQRARASRS